MPLTAPDPTFAQPMGGEGCYAFLDADGEILLTLNGTYKPISPGDLLKPARSLESGPGCSKQWRLGDGLPVGGVLTLNGAEQWRDAVEEGDVLSGIRYALINAVSVLDTHTNTSMSIWPATPYDLRVIRGDRRYGPFNAVSIEISAVDKAELKAFLEANGD